ncbi:hypothetical protein QJS10_CPA08g00723 [Acorus calamus]|uniref:DUF4283 domain-containing protein n=1 Tax=Acorus calamus TaxID=4465 RepID=A0AAV9EAV3_ACOCL|nr:hypothetical protein QJS10_CPA08g00723 [Acorus calamus]
MADPSPPDHPGTGPKPPLVLSTISDAPDIPGDSSTVSLETEHTSPSSPVTVKAIPNKAGTIDNILKMFSTPGGAHDSSRPAQTPGASKETSTLPNGLGPSQSLALQSQPRVLVRGESSKSKHDLGKGLLQEMGRPPRAKQGDQRAHAPTVRQNASQPQVQPRRKPQLKAAPPVVTTEARAWRDLFQSPSPSQGRDTMTFIPPTMEGDLPVVEVDEADYTSTLETWGKALVGYIIGTTPVYTPFLQFLRRLWKPKGEINLMLKGNGFFMVNFDNEEDLQEVLEGGPWTMASRPFVIHRWSPHSRMELERLTSIPIWVKFPDLPLHMWSLDCLNKIASGIGIPLYRDAATRQGTRISYARVCVEIEAGKPLPDSIVVNSKIGGRQEYKVVYDWKPRACSHCHTFGHDDSMCCKKPKETLVDQPKGTSTQVWKEVQYPKHKHGDSTTIQTPPVGQNSDANANQFALLQTLEDTGNSLIANRALDPAAMAMSAMKTGESASQNCGQPIARKEVVFNNTHTESEQTKVNLKTASPPTKSGPTLSTLHEVAVEEAHEHQQFAYRRTKTQLTLCQLCQL